MTAPLAPFSLPVRYRLEGGIAAGGMAAVYAAHDTLLDRPVAVKVLAEHLNEDPTARRRFQREARAAAGLSSHPSVVTIFDVGEHEGRSFIVMERRTGGTVGDQLLRGAVDPQRALAWLRGTAEALDAAHERGVVHRDIKPGNLLLDEHDRVGVADFGIASLAHESDRYTATGQVLGTAAYISPEQATGDPATPASDRYSLAAVAFELLTGRKPFDAAHFAAQARAHIEDPVPSASQVNPRLPRAVDAVLRRGMAKDPQQRLTTAAAFVEALERALDDVPTEATRAMPPQAVAAAPAPRAHAPARAAAAPPRRTAPAPRRPGSRPPAAAAAGRRRGIPLVAAAAAVLLLAAGALAIGLGGGDDPTGDAGRQSGRGEQPSRETSTPDADAEGAQEPDETATADPTAAATAEPGASTPSGSPAALNDEGYRLFQDGRYDEAIPYFRQAVEACGSSTELVCAYATYNLGASLNRAGDPEAAIPVLQQRLERWPDDQRETVEAELARACEAAGQKDCSGASSSAAPQNGKAKGRSKRGRR